ncbi:MAG: hypothetical protein WD669_05050 [Pirellulales bacterium]
MNAMEKVAWTELVVSAAAMATAAGLIPWLGNRASGAFGLLGLLVCSIWFLRRRGPGVVVDERDREIERRAIKVGVEAAWMTLFLSLIAFGMWAQFYNEGIVPVRFLTWLVWVQFAICYGLKGLVGVMSYRRQRRAA